MALKGKQKNIDANKNGKIDGDDFAMLRGKKGSSKAADKKKSMPKKKGK